MAESSSVIGTDKVTVTKLNLTPRKLNDKTSNIFCKRSLRWNFFKNESDRWNNVDGIKCVYKVMDSQNKSDIQSGNKVTKMSLGIVNNIKKRFCIKQMMYKPKQKVKALGPVSSRGTNVHSFVPSWRDDIVTCSANESKNDKERNVVSKDSENLSCSESGFCDTEGALRKEYLPKESKGTENLQTNIGFTAQSVCSTRKIEDEALHTVDAKNTLSKSTEKVDSDNENTLKLSLTGELLKLSKYGWYWGPISGDEADAKLISEPDGAFLVRDSSDDRYLLTLSFKSAGKLLHARLEHSGGLFSLWNRTESQGFTSVAALIDYSMNFSRSAVFCYSRPKHPGYPSFPVRLTKPISRFTQVRSLQYLCRFVIRQNTRLDNIHKLPLPKTIKGYIEEAHY